MPRGKHLYGPGFWKQDTDWLPGGGGFRGGNYPHGGSGAYGRWLRPCHRFAALYGPYPPAAGQQVPEQSDYLRAQAEYIKSELAEVEKRLADLENE